MPRRPAKYPYQGKWLTATEIAALTGMSAATVYRRFRGGEGLAPKIRNQRLITFRGQTKNLKAWAEEIGVRSITLIARLKKHPLEIALTLPPHQGQRIKKGEGGAKNEN